MNVSLQPEQAESTEKFREQRRRKRNPSDEQATLRKKTAVKGNSVRDPRIRLQAETPTRNFFAPLRTEMELGDSKEESNNREQEPTNQAGRPPPIILFLQQTSYSCRNTSKAFLSSETPRTETRVMIKEMTDFTAIKSFFLSKILCFYSFIPKSQKLVNAVISHLPSITPAEEIYEALVERGFDVISVKQMTITRRSPSEDPEKSIVPPFLIILPRNEESQDIFNFCHISSRVEA
jgi:hypothetical protein